MAINSLGYNTQRISGLFSGMDTQSLVENMLAADQAKIDNVFRQQEKAQWKLDAYSELNSAVSNLRDTYLSVLGEKSLIKNAAYHNYNVTMSDNSAIRITGTSSAMPTNFQVLSATRATSARAVNQLDSSQTEVTGKSLLQAQAKGSDTGLTGEATIGSLAEQFGLKDGESLSFSINGETFTFTQDKSLNHVIATVNGNTKANATMSLEDGVMSIKSNVIGEGTGLNFSNIKGTAFAADKGFGIKAGEAGKSSILSAAEVATMSFTELAEKMGVEFSEGNIQINGRTFGIGPNTTIGNLMSRINNANTGVTMSFDETTGSFTFRNKADADANTAENAAINLSGVLFGKNSIMGVEEGTYRESGSVKRNDTLAEVGRKLGKTVGDTLNFSINGVDFSFDTRTATLNDVMNKVNNDPNAKAVFSYSEMTDSFEIRSAETGKSTALEISGMDTLFGLGGKNGVQVQAGTDATLQVDINGTRRTIEQSSNMFTLDGLNFEIIGEHKATDDAINVNVERDYQPTIDAVKSFIEDYNKVVEALNTKYYEQTYRSYQPLTEEERAAITEDEAKKWDEKAMSGVLRNDSVIGNLLTNLRQSLSIKVGDTGMSAFDIGISTVPWSSDSWRTEQGKLVLDEEKLLAALKEDPNAVQKVLSGISEDGEVTTNGMTSESGLLVRMNEFMRSFNTTMRTQNIQNTTKEIAGYAEKTTDLLTKMSEKEERYWALYSSMETMMAEMQSQQQWMASMLGMGTATN